MCHRLEETISTHCWLNYPKSNYVRRSIPITLMYQCPKKAQPARLEPLHNALSFYSIELLHYFSTRTSILPAKFPVSCTKQVRNGLLLGSPTFPLRRRQGPRPCFPSHPLRDESCREACRICSLPGRLALGFWISRGHPWTLVFLVCQATTLIKPAEYFVWKNQREAILF